jgi:arsenate reductase-like glutaredoxin family protein
MTCKKAQGFLESNDWSVSDQTDAGKQRRGAAEALALAKTVKKIVAAKGKKIVTFDMLSDPPDDETLLAHLLGPSGNLRAPTLRKGQTLVVGFTDEAYRQVLGK